jgi:urea carboxylase
MESEPSCVGAVQITPDGTPIVLGPDGPTIGGYPKIAVVCSADIWKLAQLRPGQRIAFERIELEEPRQLSLAREKWLKRTSEELSDR